MNIILNFIFAGMGVILWGFALMLYLELWDSYKKQSKRKD